MSYHHAGDLGGTSRPDDRAPNALSTYPYGPAYQRREADLARVRENQRRSRARRREYVTDLENRLRQCELLGIEASAEVALGARRVTEENRQLRELLHAHGVDDRHIAHYVQNAHGSWEAAPGTIPPMAGESPVQSLEQLLAPRRPISQEPPIPPFTVPSQASREDSAPSQAASTPPAWQPPSKPAGSGSYGSPPTSTGSTKATDDPVAYSYPTPYATSHSNHYLASTNTPEAPVHRAQRYDPPTPSRAFEDEDHDHGDIRTSGLEEDTKLGCTAPQNTYSGSDAYRPGHHDT
ncbi:hypothetical protein CC79DRAFT_1366965 [Sarocladium strictum]